MTGHDVIESETIIFGLPEKNSKGDYIHGG